ncbi:hypothetical protein [Deinococcus sp.]|uniref:hypothetical protein n=1 Tax=Deinococcus sp. TaxID=47478 RepID=UPI0025C18287|nr:hypothetical protein [Deinococcus sp.]
MNSLSPSGLPFVLPARLEALRGTLIVSVQADDGSPLREVAHIVALSRAALLGGASALRLRSPGDIRAVRAVTDAALIGLTMQAQPDSLNSPALAGQALATGAHAVVVGSAITRPDHVTRSLVRGRPASPVTQGDGSHPVESGGMTRKNRSIRSDARGRQARSARAAGNPAQSRRPDESCGFRLIRCSSESIRADARRKGSHRWNVRVGMLAHLNLDSALKRH